MTFHVGQKVVCVDVGPHHHRLAETRIPIGLVLGEIYTVREVDFRAMELHGQPTIRLFEVVLPSRYTTVGDWESGYAAHRFRPLIERKSSTSTGFEILDDIRKRESVDDVAPVKKRREVKA